MVASRRLYILLALGMVPFICAVWWTWTLDVGLIYDAVLLIFLWGDYHLTQKPTYLTATRQVANRLSIGRVNTVSIEILNSGPVALKCRIKDDYPREIRVNIKEFAHKLPARARVRLLYDLTPTARGAYEFGDIHIRYLSVFGLVWRTQAIRLSQSVKVYSDLKSLQELFIKLSHSSELGDMHQQKRGIGTDFANLKEYTVGDDSRQIDWKATARRDRPVIRTYEAEREQVLLILIDAGRMMFSDLEGLSRFDHALNAALSLSLAGQLRGDMVGMGIFADKPLLYLPPRRGKAQMKRILESTFNIKPRMVEPDYTGVLSYFASAQKGRALVVVITDLTDPTGSQTLLNGLVQLTPHHLPFCVTLRDRQIDQLATNYTYSLSSIYRRAVAMDLVHQRELAFSTFTRQGCLVLDCPPQELSNQLVDRYLKIKSEGIL